MLIYLEEIKKSSLEIEGIFAVYDFYNLDWLIHTDLYEKQIRRPINEMFKDFFGNCGVVILVSQKNISIEQFVYRITEMKYRLRNLVKKDYVACIFDQSKLNTNLSKNQRITISDIDGNELKKFDMNEDGQFIVLHPNSIHCPDPNVEVTIRELRLLLEYEVVSNNNLVTEEILEEINSMNTMEVVKYFSKNNKISKNQRIHLEKGKTHANHSLTKH